ncbi:MAG: 50S ribosomal protein L6 [Thermoproteus sp.]|nr:50S ribosomal protein L6 [Thermoproteus sp.]
MRVPYVREEVEAPEGVSVAVEKIGDFDYRITVKGPLGSISRELKNVPLAISAEGNKVVLEAFNARKREYAIVGAVRGLLKNMYLGVTKGWRYKLKIIYTHFPMLVKIQGSQISIENFLGRKSKISLEIPKGVKVQLQGKEDIIVEGIDRDLVGQFAANLERAVELHGDERPAPHGREGGLGVVDGIYVYAVEHLK